MLMQNADRIFHPHYLISVAAPALFHRRVAFAGSDARVTCRENRYGYRPYAV